MSAIVDPEKCKGCGVCVDVCPAGAISLTSLGKARVDEDRCTECGICVHKCPNSAIVVVRGVVPVATARPFQRQEQEVLRRDDFKTSTPYSEMESSGGRPSPLREVISSLLGTLCEGVGRYMEPTVRNRVSAQRRTPASPRRGYRRRRGRRW